MALDWPQRISAFLQSPSGFLSCSTPESFLAEVLRELRDDRASDHVKVLLLSPLCEHPVLLCPSPSEGEETALELMSVLAQCPPRSLPLRSHLLLALTSVLLCSSCVGARTRASRDFLDLLLQTVQDTDDLQTSGGGAWARPLRATACDCLRELETCRPGLLSQRLELLSGLRQRESSRLHQAYTGLHALALRNAVYLLTQQTGAGAGELRAALGSNEGVAWGEGEGEEEDSLTTTDADSSTQTSQALFSPLSLSLTGSVPTLQTGPDCKELRSLLSSLLEESYLLTPLSQAALLRGLVEVVAMVPAVSPGIFRAQLLRLLGTCEVSLLHTTLLMKAAFTDSLFSAEDEAFLLKRLVGLSQHPLLSAPEKLFHIDCLLHFPENRPISCGGEGDWGEDEDVSLPVLLTPRLAASLVPTVFNDSAGMLARLNLLSLVYLEEGGEEEGEGEGGRGLAYLYDHLTSLLRIVENRGGRETVVTSFRAAFLFLLRFGHVRRYAEDLARRLCALYLRHPRLAPHLINLADRAQERLGGSRGDDEGEEEWGGKSSSWAVELLGALQRSVAKLSSSSPRHDLRWHLKVMARVAEEGALPQTGTLSFLLDVITTTSSSSSSSSSLCAGGGGGVTGGDWRLGNGVLGVCRRLLLHPSLDAVLLTPLADLLQHLARHYGDTDIRDHARLYYTLLTTLSRDKLAGVLAQGGVRGPERGGGQQLSAKVRSIVAESEELTSALTVRRTERPLLRLEKMDDRDREEPDRNKPERLPLDLNPELDGESESPSSSPGQEDDTGGVPELEEYHAQFQNSPGFASEITLRYRLTHTTTTADGGRHDDDPSFDKLFSIRLHFDLTDGHYEEVAGDLSVPCLFRDRKSPPVVVRLRLRPRRPYPTSLLASAVFTTEDGLSWHTALPAVRVSFSEVFLPLPAPPGWRTTTGQKKKKRRRRRRVFFDRFWGEICSGEESSPETGDLANTCGRTQHATSLYCSQLGDRALGALIEKHLRPYLVSGEEDEGDDEEEEEDDGGKMKALIFLPPRSHVLLKISAEEDAVQVHIATDDWKLLPYINSYLEEITTEVTMVTTEVTTEVDSTEQVTGDG